MTEALSQEQNTGVQGCSKCEQNPGQIVSELQNSVFLSFSVKFLAGLQLVAEVCGGELQGGKVGSCEVTLIPGPIRSGRFEANPGTAGSCCLMVQVSLIGCPHPNCYIEDLTSLDVNHPANLPETVCSCPNAQIITPVLGQLVLRMD